MAYPLGTNAYSSLSELVNDKQQKDEASSVVLDGVVCCSPTATHASIVQQAVTLGVSSGVFVEKPVGQLFLLLLFFFLSFIIDSFCLFRVLFLILKKIDR